MLCYLTRIFHTNNLQKPKSKMDTALARIFHTDSSRGTTNPDADKEGDGLQRRLYFSCCPRSNSKLTQYPSGVRKPQQNRYEIGGLDFHFDSGSMYTFKPTSKCSSALAHQLSRPPRHNQDEIPQLAKSSRSNQNQKILFLPSRFRTQTRKQQELQKSSQYPFIVILGMLISIFLSLSGCTTIVQQNASDRAAINVALAKESSGHYFIGRRFYKVDYHMWGWVKEPGKPWKESRLVMFNEQKTLAPDRKKNHIGNDNNYEYRLEGYFSGDKVYEPASDSFYPEFVLSKATLIHTSPPLIFPDSRWIDPKIRLLEPPQS